MLRLIAPTLSLLLALPLAAQAASKQEYELNKMLEKVAKESSVGTPRAINEDILDQGYTVEGKALVNHLSVRQSHAERMRANPQQVRSQLGDSVCRNTGYRNLMSKGAAGLPLHRLQDQPAHHGPGLRCRQLRGRQQEEVKAALPLTFSSRAHQRPSAARRASRPTTPANSVTPAPPTCGGTRPQGSGVHLAAFSSC
jgi:hypothetical protein